MRQKLHFPLSKLRVEFLLPDREPEPSVMVACMNNDYELLGQKLKPPRNPNFKNANRVTPLYVAASKGNLH